MPRASRQSYLRKRLAAYDALQLERVMLLLEPATTVDCVTCPQEALQLLRPLLLGHEVELLAALFLDARHRVLAAEVLSRGSGTNTIVDPRTIYRRALMVGAYSIVLGHNHPSGDLRASHADIEVTKRLVEAGQILGVAVVDHLIVTSDDYRSMLAEGDVAFPNVKKLFTVLP